MTQYARPISPDISTGGWTTAPLWDDIEETPYSDLDYITSSKNAGGDICEVSLGAVSTPSVRTGHTVNYRARCDKTDNGTIIVSLVQGTTVIRSYDPGFLTTSFAPYSFTLSEAEAQNITNYGDLRLRFSGTCTANAYVFLSWAELQIPDAAPSGNRVRGIIVNA